MSDTNMVKLVALVRVGELAVDLWRAEGVAADAREAYHDRIRHYENTFNAGCRVKFDPTDPAEAAIVGYTREQYAAAQAAKKRVYSAKQKLRRAAAKVAALSATSSTEEAAHA